MASECAQVSVNLWLRLWISVGCPQGVPAETLNPNLSKLEAFSDKPRETGITADLPAAAAPAQPNQSG